MNGEADPTGGELVGVGFASHPVEAQMIKGLLESEGIRCLVRSSRTGGRAVMVHAARAEQARALLEEAKARAETEAETLPGSGGGEELGDTFDPVAERFDGGPREVGLFGSHARAFLLAFAVLGFSLGVFLLLRSV